MENVKRTVERYIAGEPLEYVFFWGGYLSNWYKSPFTIEGISYCCVEQYMMAGKARLFGDKVAETNIMKSTNPRYIKQQGREVKGFNTREWEEARVDIVREGNLAKFKQDARFKKYLKETRGKILVEASPYDKIWGIGLSKDEPSVKDPRTWRGNNLLGYVLMDVRDELGE